MAQQTRRAPGRPKKADTQPAAPAVVAEAPKPKAKKSVPIKQRIQENKACVYEALKNKGVAFMLMTKQLRIYDEESDSIRIARYCPNEDSIWKENQSELSKVEPITFRDGYLTVRADQPNLRAFLDIHPANVANGGKMFKKIDNKVNSEKEVEKEFEVFDAISLVKSSELNDLLAVALYFKVNIDRNISEIKFDLLKIAKKNPSGFIHQNQLNQEWGDDYRKNSELARRAFLQFADQDLVKFMEQTGLGNHPGFAKMFNRMGEFLTEDNRLVGGNDGLVGGMSPTTAQAKITERKSDPEFMAAYMNGEHPEHANAVKEFQSLFNYLHPEN